VLDSDTGDAKSELVALAAPAPAAVGTALGSREPSEAPATPGAAGCGPVTPNNAKADVECATGRPTAT
jgi:hypothetical protein